MKIRLVQANPVVGDIQFNASLIIKEVRLAYDIDRRLFFLNYF